MACLQPHHLQPSAGEGSSRQPGEARSTLVPVRLSVCSQSLGTLLLPGSSSPRVRARILLLAPALPRRRARQRGAVGDGAELGAARRLDSKSGERERELAWLEGGGTAGQAADPAGQRLITPAASFSVLNERALISPPPPAPPRLAEMLQDEPTA